MIATNVKYDVAEKFLEEADNSVKLAIFMIKSGLDKDSAKSILDRQEGYISEALKSIENCKINNSTDNLSILKTALEGYF